MVSWCLIGFHHFVEQKWNWWKCFGQWLQWHGDMDILTFMSQAPWNPSPKYAKHEKQHVYIVDIHCNIYIYIHYNNIYIYLYTYILYVYLYKHRKSHLPGKLAVNFLPMTWIGGKFQVHTIRSLQHQAHWKDKDDARSVSKPFLFVNLLHWISTLKPDVDWISLTKLGSNEDSPSSKEKVLERKTCSSLPTTVLEDVLQQRCFPKTPRFK